jgi:hypothetical protein
MWISGQTYGVAVPPSGESNDGVVIGVDAFTKCGNAVSLNLYIMPGVFVLIFLLFICPFCNAQKDGTGKKPLEEVITVEYNASFPGGEDSLKKFLFSKFTIPDSLLESDATKIHGTIIASYTIEKDGTPSEFKIEKSVHPALDTEWLRVLMLMPKWNPAMQNGRTIISHKRQSITIDIDD